MTCSVCFGFLKIYSIIAGGSLHCLLYYLSPFPITEMFFYSAELSEKQDRKNNVSHQIPRCSSSRCRLLPLRHHSCLPLDLRLNERYKIRRSTTNQISTLEYLQSVNKLVIFTDHIKTKNRVVWLYLTLQVVQNSILAFD